MLATGGGAVLLPENRAALRERGFVVYLKTSLEQQAERVRQGRNRPLLHDVDPLTKLDRAHGDARARCTNRWPTSPSRPTAARFTPWPKRSSRHSRRPAAGRA